MKHDGNSSPIGTNFAEFSIGKYKGSWEAEMTLELEHLGAFSFISFLKRTFPIIDQREFDSLMKSPRGPLGDWRDVELRDAELFREMSDSERKAMIYRQATDLHESHHFHTLLLVPAGGVLLTLLLLRLRDAFDVFDKLRSRFQAGQEPFEEPILLGQNRAIDGLLSYYLDGTLTEYASQEERTGMYPAAYMVKYDTGPKGSIGPALRFDGRTYPIGLRVILEGWTESLIRALVFLSRPREYYEWYQSTREGSELWLYTLIERALGDIFGTAYSSLDPTNQYTLISHLCLSACEIRLPDKQDFMEHRDNHPGWNLLQLLDYLWSGRDLYIKDNLVDVVYACRSLKRFLAIMNNVASINNIGGSSLLDHLVDLRYELNEPQPDYADLISTFWREYSYYHNKILSLHLQHPDVFYSASEWLNCTQRDLLPRVPIMIAMHPGAGRAKLNFPDERRTDFWFTWFLISQLTEYIIGRNPACPIVIHDVEAECPRDEACEIPRIKGKDSRCYLHQILSTKPSKT